LLGDEPALAPLLAEVGERIDAVVERIASGDHAGAAEQFIAPTFLDEATDPEQLDFDLNWIRGFSQPALLTLGDQSPPAFAPVVAKLAKALPRVEVLSFPGAGHIPHATDPESYVEWIIAFTRTH
jgi:pimeloyl-ACP methyl ester carboxylesterase